MKKSTAKGRAKAEEKTTLKVSTTEGGQALPSAISPSQSGKNIFEIMAASTSEEKVPRSPQRIDIRKKKLAMLAEAYKMDKKDQKADTVLDDSNNDWLEDLDLAEVGHSSRVDKDSSSLSSSPKMDGLKKRKKSSDEPSKKKNISGKVLKGKGGLEKSKGVVKKAKQTVKKTAKISDNVLNSVFAFEEEMDSIPNEKGVINSTAETKSAKGKVEKKPREFKKKTKTTLNSDQSEKVDLLSEGLSVEKLENVEGAKKEAKLCGKGKKISLKKPTKMEKTQISPKAQLSPQEISIQETIDAVVNAARCQQVLKVSKSEKNSGKNKKRKSDDSEAGLFELTYEISGQKLEAMYGTVSESEVKKAAPKKKRKLDKKPSVLNEPSTLAPMDANYEMNLEFKEIVENTETSLSIKKNKGKGKKSTAGQKRKLVKESQNSQILNESAIDTKTNANILETSIERGQGKGKKSPGSPKKKRKLADNKNGAEISGSVPELPQEVEANKIVDGTVDAKTESKKGGSIKKKKTESSDVQSSSLVNDGSAELTKSKTDKKLKKKKKKSGKMDTPGSPSSKVLSTLEMFELLQNTKNVRKSKQDRKRKLKMRKDGVKEQEIMDTTTDDEIGSKTDLDSSFEMFPSMVGTKQSPNAKVLDIKTSHEKTPAKVPTSDKPKPKTKAKKKNHNLIYGKVFGRKKKRGVKRLAAMKRATLKVPSVKVLGVEPVPSLTENLSINVSSGSDVSKQPETTSPKGAKSPGSSPKLVRLGSVISKVARAGAKVSKIKQSKPKTVKQKGTTHKSRDRVEDSPKTPKSGDKVKDSPKTTDDKKVSDPKEPKAKKKKVAKPKDEKLKVEEKTSKLKEEKVAEEKKDEQLNKAAESNLVEKELNSKNKVVKSAKQGPAKKKVAKKETNLKPKVNPKPIPKKKAAVSKTEGDTETKKKNVVAEETKNESVDKEEAPIDSNTENVLPTTTDVKTKEKYKRGKGEKTKASEKGKPAVAAKNKKLTAKSKIGAAFKAKSKKILKGKINGKVKSKVKEAINEIGAEIKENLENVEKVGNAIEDKTKPRLRVRKVKDEAKGEVVKEQDKTKSDQKKQVKPKVKKAVGAKKPKITGKKKAETAKNEPEEGEQEKRETTPAPEEQFDGNKVKLSLTPKTDNRLAQLIATVAKSLDMEVSLPVII